MNRFNMRNILSHLFISFSVMVLISCSDDGPTSPSISDYSGDWSGSIEHPAYDGGSLQVEFVEKESIGGNYSMRLVDYIESNGRSRVENYGGEVTSGNRNSRSSISFTISVRGSLWDFDGTLQADNMVSGTWNVRERTGISGTFQISR